MIVINDFSDRDTIVLDIERLCSIDGIEYLDAIAEYCEKNDLDIDAIGKIITEHPVLKLKVTEEAENKNYIEKTSRLPL